MLKSLFTAAVLAVIAVPAYAHVTLEKGEAPVDSTYKAVARVSHGCEGKPTIAVRVQIPEGVIAVKPMPKAGWSLEKVRGAYARAYTYHGSEVTEGVKELVWSGGTLVDDEYDEFVFRGFLTKDLEAGTTLYFPVVQECPGGEALRWIEIPAEGQDAHDLKAPAPGLKLLEKGGHHH